MEYPLLVGSRALEYWGVGFTAGPLSDWDLIVPEEDRYEYNDLERVDLSHDTDLDNRYVLDTFRSGLHIDLFGHKVEVCNPVGLAYLKRSHLARDYNWDKHITHYHFSYLKEKTGFDMDRCLERQKLTLKRYGQGNPRLKQTNEDFFDDAVKKVFDHDWLHELVSYGKRPRYTLLKQKDKANLAWCEKDLWLTLPHHQKLQCVAEEATVIACERFMIPKNWNYGERRAYSQALKKVCTTLCSGWFRDFAIDNYPLVMDMFDTTRFRLVKEKTHEV